jgi:hypothetical protein
MTQLNPQQIQALAAQSERAASVERSAPTEGIRTVALALLVDRALSA